MGRKKIGMRACQTVSNRFKLASAQRVEDLKQIKLKKKTAAKVHWAVRAYNNWRDCRIRIPGVDERIISSDLENLQDLDKKAFEVAMCYFVCEVTKKKDGSPYPGKTLYQMCEAIQKHLNVNKIQWKLIHSNCFLDLRNVLDNVMKERTAMNIGVVTKQAQLISYDQEEVLWQKGVLGEDTPDKLRDTVQFLLGFNFFLRAVGEHYSLRR